MIGLKIDQHELEKICASYGVEFLGVFGSAAREESRPDSDLDVLVRFGKNGAKGLMAMVAMERQLERVLGGKKVDLVTKDFLSPYFREDVLAQVKPVYGKA